MMDENTIEHIERIREKQQLLKRYEEERALKNFYEEIRKERVKQNKLRKTLKIIVISFALLITLMSANLQTLSSWEKKAMNWFLQYPYAFENPFNIKQ